MKKTQLPTLLSALLMLIGGSQASAAGTNLDVTFTATLREVTCDMRIEGGTGDGTDNTIPIGTDGKINVMDIISGSDAASSQFTLRIIECPNSLVTLKTTITGSASSSVKAAIANSATTNKADYTGVTLARVSAPNAPFEINATDDSKSLVWTATEIANLEVPLIARLVETQSGQATGGNFSAVATFNFEYQ